jgi:uncharacterized protein (TIGR03435 family)
VVTKSGFRESKITGPRNPDMRRLGGRAPFDRFTDSLAVLLGRPVIDKTGISGAHNLIMEVPLDDYPMSPSADGPASVPAAVSTVIFGALEQQLGLKLESGKAPLDVLVIDHIEKPSAN